MRKSNLKIIFHYLIIYLVIISQGAVINNNNEEFFIILELILSFLFLLAKRRLFQIDKNLFHIYCIFAGLAITVVITQTSLSVNSVGNVMSKLLLAYLAVNFDTKNFTRLYVNMVVFFASCSLIIFFMQLVNYEMITNLLTQSEQINGACYGWALGTVVAKHATRNVGLATEPGRYQIYLIPALYFLFFKSKQLHLSIKRNMIYRIVIFAALVTAQSTTGYIALLILLLSFALSNIYRTKFDNDNRYLYKNTNRLLVAVCVITIVYLFMTSGENFIYENFVDKLFNSSGKLDLSSGTGSVRVISMLTDLKLAFKNPLGMGFKDYQPQWIANKIKFIGEPSSCVGLTISCAAFGFPVTFLILKLYI